MGRFADAHIDQLSDGELAELENLLELPDQELLGWITGTAPSGFDNGVFRRLCEYHFKTNA